VYDMSGGLVAELSVPPGGTCGLWPCWEAIEKVERLGLKYDDRDLTHDGVRRLRVRTGEAGKGRFAIKAANKATHGWDNMPVGLAATLGNGAGAIIQMSARDAMCVTSTLNSVKALPGLYSARKSPRRMPR